MNRFLPPPPGGPSEGAGPAPRPRTWPAVGGKCTSANEEEREKEGKLLFTVSCWVIGLSCATKKGKQISRDPCGSDGQYHMINNRNVSVYGIRRLSKSDNETTFH